MASTFSDLGIELMATGENAGTWGTKTNTNLQIVEKAIAGYVEKSIAGGAQTTTLSITDGDTTESTSVARHAVIKLTGTITGNQVVTVPDSIEKVYIVVNGTSGAFSVQFKTASGTGVTFGSSDKGTRLLFSDGTNIVDTATGGVGSYDLNGETLILDADQDTNITADTDDQIDIAIAGADDFQFTANTFTALSGSTIATNTIAETTSGSGVTIDSVLIKDNKVDVNGTAGAIILDADADTHIGANTDDEILFTAAGEAQLKITDGAILPSTDDNIDLGSSSAQFKDGFFDGTLEADAITVGGTAVLTGGAVTSITSILNTSLVVGRDADNDIDFATDNNILFRASGADQIKLVDGALAPVTDNDVDLGTSSLEFKDAFFDGTVTADALAADTANIDGGSIDGATLGTNSAITQAVIDNININGATIGHTSDTDLLTLASGVLTVAGEVSMTTLDIGGTNVTSTAAELNIVDGGTSATSTTVADADRVVLNDNGTMVQVAVTDLAAYFDDEITAMPNLTSVGTLTSLTVDNIIINGTNIGHTSDTDALAIDSSGNVTASQNLTVTGDLTVNGTTTTVNSTTVTIDDPIFTLGGDTAPGSDDNKDRGIEFRYHTGSAAKVGFFGFDDSTSKFTFIADATNSSEVFSGSAGDVAFGAISATSIDADGGVTVDNITIDGTEIDLSSGDLTIDVAGDLVLDAGGGDFKFGVGGTEILNITNSSSDVIIKPVVDAKDLIFQQRDGTEVARIEDNGTFNIVTDKLAINGTAVTSTAVELNILDGVTSTASELNLLDGDTSVGGSITIADSDGVVVNDGGTMKTVPASDFKTLVGASAGGFSIANLDIDGGTDIGEAIVDADLFIVDNGAGGTNRKVAASRLTTYINANANFASVGKAIAMAIVFG